MAKVGNAANEHRGDGRKHGEIIRRIATDWIGHKTTPEHREALLSGVDDAVTALEATIESKNAALDTYHALVAELRANQRTGRIVHGDA